MRKIIDWFGKTFNNTWLSMFVKGIFHLFDNTRIGYSAKKTTAIVFLICVVKMHFDYCDYAITNANFELFPTILGVDIATILGLFGINEYSKSKSRQNNEQNVKQHQNMEGINNE